MADGVSTCRKDSALDGCACVDLSAAGQQREVIVDREDFFRGQCAGEGAGLGGECRDERGSTDRYQSGIAQRSPEQGHGLLKSGLVQFGKSICTQQHAVFVSLGHGAQESAGRLEQLGVLVSGHMRRLELVDGAARADGLEQDTGLGREQDKKDIARRLLEHP